MRMPIASYTLVEWGPSNLLHSHSNQFSSRAVIPSMASPLNVFFLMPVSNRMGWDEIGWHRAVLWYLTAMWWSNLFWLRTNACPSGCGAQA